LSEGPLSKSFLRGESSFPRETPNLSIVVPYFNEIHRVGLILPEIVGLANPSVEVVLVDDGSTDGTVKVLREAAQNTDNVHFQQCSFPTMFISNNVHFQGFARNCGKGAAIRAGIAVTTGFIVMFMDADLATDLADLPVLLQALESADVAIGS
jgi:glycosyltransferase involved in cell wall biosynthesis